MLQTTPSWRARRRKTTSSRIAGGVLVLVAAMAEIATAQEGELVGTLEDLFGGEVFVGEIPESVVSALPLLEGVTIAAAHVGDDSLTAILETEADAASVILRYGQHFDAEGWRRTSWRLGSDDTALNLCSPEGSLLRVWPLSSAGPARARVELRHRFSLCSLPRDGSRSSGSDPARSLLEELRPPSDCRTLTGGRAGSAGLSWWTTSDCASSPADVNASILSTQSQASWHLLASERSEGWALSLWEKETDRAGRSIAFVTVRPSESGGAVCERFVWLFGDGIAGEPP